MRSAGGGRSVIRPARMWTPPDVMKAAGADDGDAGRVSVEVGDERGDDRRDQDRLRAMALRLRDLATASGADAPAPAAPAWVLVLRGQERFTRREDAAAIERVAIGRFANGELHVEVPAGVDGCRCVVVGSISPPAGNLERLTLLAHALRRAGADRIVALVPYLAYARQDRARPTESLGLAWVGELLRASGIDEVVCVDAHSDLAGDVLGIPITSLSPAPLLADALPGRWREGVTFVAPDEGAIARCGAVAAAAGAGGPIVWVRKRRTPAGVASSLRPTATRRPGTPWPGRLRCDASLALRRCASRPRSR